MQVEPQTIGSAAAQPGRATTALLARYDRPGPRYTSYPTAVQFDERIGASDYEARLEAAGKCAEKPLSLYVHLPFCAKRCLFCGCNVVISPDASRAQPYLELVLQEAELVARRLGARRAVSQVHLGGGTPTYFGPDELTGFLADLFAIFPPDDEAELAVEVDPRVTSHEHVDALAEIGFNRMSIGVQDFTPGVQHAIGRVQSIDATARLIERARCCGFAGINVDLVYGLPRQTPEDFAMTADAVVALGADRSAVYSFAYVPWLHAHMKKLAAAELPDREGKLASFVAARERFLAAGYEAVGIDHFALPSDELAVAKRRGGLGRNFQGYCVAPPDDVIGLGMSAIGDVAGAYVQNAKKLSTYSNAIHGGRVATERGCVRGPDDEIRRRVIHDLMCNFRIDIPAVETRYAIDFSSYFSAELVRLRALADDGLVSVDEARITATATGALLVRNLAMCFDRYLGESEGERPFSRTV